MDPEAGNYCFSFILLNANSIWEVLANDWMPILLFFLLLCVSFLVSGAEVAFFSLEKSEIANYKGQKENFTAQSISRLIGRPKHLLATILIVNNLVNIFAILIFSKLVRNISKALGLGQMSRETFGFDIMPVLIVLITLGFLLFFGEIVPKVYAAKNKVFMVNILARPLELLMWFCNPFSNLLIRITRFLDHKVPSHETASLEDLKHAIDLATKDEAHQDEKEILKGIVNFGNISVKSIMRARVDVTAIEVSTSLEEILDLINEHNFSRMPVYQENLDQILGILHIKDLLPFLKQDMPAPNLKELLRPVHFVPESKKIDVLLEEFKTRRLHMAVVVDEFGGTAGIVSLEDVIEEIFGEINDEFDSEDWVYSKVSEDTYIFEGRISLNDLKKILQLADDEFEDARGDNDSLGGLILELHGKIPQRGDEILYKHFEFHIESVSNNRIAMVKVVIKAEEEAS